MTASFSSEDRHNALRWLRHGAELARDAKGEDAKHRDVVWLLIAESVLTVDALPDQDKRWLTSGTRSGGWNMVGMTQDDSRQVEQLRLLSAMKPYDGMTKTKPQGFEIERAIDVMGWLNWCNEARLADRLKKAAVALARGGETDQVHRIYCPQRKPNRQNIAEIKTRTVGMILSGLKRDLGIVPGDGIGFVEYL